MVEKKLRERDTTVLALKTQIKYQDRMTEESKRAKEEAKKLREELILLKGCVG